MPLKWGQLTTSIIKSFAKNIELKTYRGLTHSSSDVVCISINIAFLLIGYFSLDKFKLFLYNSMNTNICFFYVE